MFKIGNYPEGYDLSLLNTIHYYPKKFTSEDGTTFYTPEVIDLIIKDNVSGDKFLETIEAPTYEYYMIKDDVFVDYNLDFIEEDKCNKIEVPNTMLLKDIAERTGSLQFYYNNINNNNRKNNRALHCHPRVMNSDMDLEDNYRLRFSKIYKNSYTKPSKSYLDIEVDSLNCKGDFVELGECPINAVSFIDDKNLVIHSFLLRTKGNDLISEFEAYTHSSACQGELVNFIINAVGGFDKAKKYKIPQMKVKFHFFDEEDEIVLIQSVFNHINSLKPDFVLAWNMAFDIPYIIERIKVLGYEPTDIMCHHDFKYRCASYFIDKDHANAYEERNDFAKISSYSVYLDQMIQFASRRKGGPAIPRYKLDYIGEMTCGVKKLDYSHITKNIEELPYKDYKTFVFYNIMDTIVQYCIEYKSNDIDNIYNTVLSQNTRFTKAYRQTVFLKNRADISYYRNNKYILGNNTNINTPKEKFPGAFCSDPTKNSDYAKLPNCRESRMGIYDNLDDFDYKALYPNDLSEFNMASNTIIAHLNIPNKVCDEENRFNKESFKWKREGQFMEDLQSHCWIEYFHRWFHLASYEEMYDDVIEYFTKVKSPMGKLYKKEFGTEYQVFEKLPDKMETSVFIPVNDEERDSNILTTLYENKSDINIPKLSVNIDNLNYDRGLSCTNPKDIYIEVKN